MSAVQIVCIIGALFMSFIIGRATKRVRIPIMGILIFKDEDNNPKLMFKCDKFSDLQKFTYVAIKIESRQNQSL